MPTSQRELDIGFCTRDQYSIPDLTGLESMVLMDKKVYDNNVKLYRVFIKSFTAKVE